MGQTIFDYLLGSFSCMRQVQTAKHSLWANAFKQFSSMMKLNHLEILSWIQFCQTEILNAKYWVFQRGTSVFQLKSEPGDVNQEGSNH